MFAPDLSKSLLAALVLLAACGAPSPDRSASALPSAPAADDASFEVEVLQGGAPAPGEVEVWALHEGAFDPRALVLVGRETGDRVETSRRLATWSGQARDGRVRVPGKGGAAVLVMAQRGAWYGEVEVRRGEAARIELIERETLTVYVADATGDPVMGVPVGLAAREARGGQRMLPITALSGEGGEAILYGGPVGVSSGPLEAVLRAPFRDGGDRAVAPGMDARLVVPRWAIVDLQLPAVEGARTPSAVVQVFAAAEGSRSTRALTESLAPGDSRWILVEGGTPLRAIVALRDPDDPFALAGRTSLDLGSVAPRRTHEEVIDVAQWTELTGTVQAAGEPLPAGTSLDLSLAPALRESMRVTVREGGAFRWYLPPGAVSAGDLLKIQAGRARGQVPIDGAGGRALGVGTIPLR